MTDDVEDPLCFAVLGLLRASRAGLVIELGAAKPRAVLAVLLLGRNTVVSRDQIIAAVWGDAPPSSAVNLVQTYVAGLRRVLEPSRARRARSDLLTSVGDGYLLRVEPGALDLDRFEERVALAARLRADGDPAGAARELDAVLGLWLGEPLGGVPGLFAEVERGRLVERRLAVVEERAELGLATGTGTALVGELSWLVGEHPLRERMHALLMRALCQAGRPAEALAAYQRARRVLVDELGVEPGPELRRLHQAVLAGAELEPERPAVAVAAPARTVPAQLPREPSAFLGREAELARLDGLLAARAAAGLLLLVTGTAGVGKTALAVHWAHRVRAEFPDGQLYVDLHGYDPAQEPLDPGEVLSRFLRSLGVPPAQLPDGLEERAALFRTVVADRRMIVVLDNVRDTAGVLPLLPGSRSCVLVTSRRRLVSLVAHADARLVELDLLTVDTAVEVLGRIAGERGAAELPALRRLAELCDRLPLALRIAAARLAVEPTLLVAELVAELDDEHGRLSALGLEDGDSSVRAAFDASRRALDPVAARLIALLGLHPGPDVTVWLVAALLREPLVPAQRAVDALCAANLLSVGEPGRYLAHDLVRAYSRALADELPEPDRRAATGRLLDFYLHCADLADDLLPIGRGAVRIAPECPPAEVPAMAGSAEAMAWLDAERANLLAAAELAAGSGWLTHAWQLPYTLSRFFWLRTDRETWLGTHEVALRAALELGDPDAQFVTLFNLGVVLLQFRRFDEALARQREALAVARSLGDADRQARALTAIANTLQDVGRVAESEAYYREAMEASRVGGSRWSEANAHHNLGLLYLALRRHADAVPWLRTALRMYHEVAELCGESAARTDLAEALLELGEHDLALDSARDALVNASQAASPYHEALAHDRIASVLHRRGAAGAGAHWQRALVLLTELDAPEAERVRASLAES
ncbi:tetratricopeptide repeat protein [Solihabitans fulvus]|uniref:Tetratricopeptide repeat protein n=1 Tax=Solihabitans fulvus TaxID=1892852 RepID=A0A5B2X6K9_9PSEU|nr:AfsR/SARP family transcriptional regulator [Solihabitans fulvus]KAA2258771.1 tetratricopeptide repeat protein [Solihabitans fulvus]